METKKITLTRKEIEAMAPGELSKLLIAAHKVEATAVVRDNNGDVKYDCPELAGSYGEEFL